MPSMARIRRSSHMRCTTSRTSIAAMGNMEATLASLRLADQNSAHVLPVHRSFHLTSIAHIELQQGQHRCGDSHIPTSDRAEPPGAARRRSRAVAAHARRSAVRAGAAWRRAAVPRRGGQLFAQLEDAVGRGRTCGATRRRRANGTGRHVESRDAWKRVQPLCRQVGDSRGPAERDGRRRADDASDRRCDRCERCGIRSRARHGVDARRMGPRARVPEHPRDPRMGRQR